MSRITINDNSNLVKRALQSQIEAALESCGLTAENYAKTNITAQRAIDTGALRNSITYKVQPREKTVYVGTNMEYVPYVEMGTGVFVTGGRRTPWAFQDSSGEWHITKGMKARPYIKTAVSDHASIYQRIISDNLSR